MPSIKTSKFEVTGDTSKAQKSLQDLDKAAASSVKSISQSAKEIGNVDIAGKLNAISTSLRTLNNASVVFSLITRRVEALNQTLKTLGDRINSLPQKISTQSRISATQSAPTQSGFRDASGRFTKGNPYRFLPQAEYIAKNAKLEEAAVKSAVTAFRIQGANYAAAIVRQADENEKAIQKSISRHEKSLEKASSRLEKARTQASRFYQGYFSKQSSPDIKSDIDKAYADYDKARGFKAYPKAPAARYVESDKSYSSIFSAKERQDRATTADLNRRGRAEIRQHEQGLTSSVAATVSTSTSGQSGVFGFLNKINSIMKLNNNEVSEHGRRWGQVEGVVRRLVEFYLVRGAVRQIGVITRGLFDIISVTEQTKLGFAETLSITTRLVDKVTREELPATTQVAQSLLDSSEAMEGIYDNAIKLGLPVRELSKAFVVTAGAARSAGIGLEESISLIAKLEVLALRAQIPPNVLARDVRDIFTGLNVQRTVLGNLLGLNQTMVRSWREQGKLAENLEKRLRLVGLTAKLNLTTFEGVKFALVALLSDLGRKIGTPVFDTVKEALSSIYESLVKIRENPNLMAGLTSTFTNFNSIIAKTLDSSSRLYEVLKNVAAAYATYKAATLVGAATSIATSVAGTVSGVGAVAAAGAATAAGGIATAIVTAVGIGMLAMFGSDRFYSAMVQLGKWIAGGFDDASASRTTGQANRRQFASLTYAATDSEALSRLDRQQLDKKIAETPTAGNGIGSALIGVDVQGKVKSGIKNPNGVEYEFTKEQYLAERNKAYREIDFRNEKELIKDNTKKFYTDNAEARQNYARRISEKLNVDSVTSGISGISRNEKLSPQEKKDAINAFLKANVSPKFLEKNSLNKSGQKLDAGTSYVSYLSSVLDRSESAGRILPSDAGEKGSATYKLSQDAKKITKALSDVGLFGEGNDEIKKRTDARGINIPEAISGLDAGTAGSRYRRTGAPGELESFKKNKYKEAYYSLKDKIDEVDKDIVVGRRLVAEAIAGRDKAEVENTLADNIAHREYYNKLLNEKYERIDEEAKTLQESRGSKDATQSNRALQDRMEDYSKRITRINDREAIRNTTLSRQADMLNVINHGQQDLADLELERLSSEGYSEKGKIAAYQKIVDLQIKALENQKLLEVDRLIPSLQQGIDERNSVIPNYDQVIAKYGEKSPEGIDAITNKSNILKQNAQAEGQINDLQVKSLDLTNQITLAHEKWKNKLNEIRSTYINIGQKFSDSISSGFDALNRDGGSLAGNFLRGVTEEIQGTFSQAFKGIIKEKLGFDSVVEANFLKKIPEIFKDSGEMSADNFNSGIESMSGVVQASGAVEKANSSKPSGSTVGGVADKIKGIYNSISGFFGSGSTPTTIAAGLGSGGASVGGYGKLIDSGSISTVAGYGSGNASGVAAAVGKGGAAGSGAAPSSSGGVVSTAATAVAARSAGGATGSGAAAGYLALIVAFINAAASANKLATLMRRQPGTTQGDILREGGRASATAFAATFLGNNALSKGLGKFLNKVDPLLGTENPAGRAIIKGLGLANLKTTESLTSQELKKAFDALSIPRLEKGTKHGVSGKPLSDVPSEYSGIGGTGAGVLFASNYQKGFGRGGFDVSSPRNAIIRSGILGKISGEDTLERYKDFIKASGGDSIETALVKLQATLVQQTQDRGGSGKAGQPFRANPAELASAINDLTDAYSALPSAIDKSALAQRAFSSDGILHIKAYNRALDDLRTTVSGVGEYISAALAGNDFLTAGKSLGESLISGIISRIKERLLATDGVLGKSIGQLSDLVNSSAEKLASGNTTGGRADLFKAVQSAGRVQKDVFNKISPILPYLLGGSSAFGIDTGYGLVNQTGLGSSLRTGYATPSFHEIQGPRGRTVSMDGHGGQSVRAPEQEDKLMGKTTVILDKLDSVATMLGDFNKKPFNISSGDVKVVIQMPDGTLSQGRVVSIERGGKSLSSPRGNLGMQ